MIKPVLSDDDFLADVKSAAELSTNNFSLWWLGQAGFLIQWRGSHLLIDPYLSDSLTVKYAATDKPHVRMTERVVDPARLDFIDVVTSSHNHTDHLDHETLWPLAGANPDLRMVVPEANRAFAADRLKCDPAWFDGCDDGESLKIGEFQITGVASAHESLEQDEAGRHKYLGYVIRFGPWSIYHSGDAVPYEGLAGKITRANNGRPLDVALLPINGRSPERRVAGNFFGREAAALAAAVRARTVVPMHYEMFEFNTAAPDEFVRAAGELGQHATVLRGGGRWDSRNLEG